MPPIADAMKADTARNTPVAQVWRSVAPIGPSWPGPAGTVPPGPEQRLIDAVARAGRRGGGQVVFVLHLSRLQPPAPRPHHRRVACAILEAVAQRRAGEVFALGGGDLVLLCREETAAQDASDNPARLGAVFARLMRIDAPDPARLTSLWHLPDDAPAVLAHARAGAVRAGEAAKAAPPEPSAAAAWAAAAELRAPARLAELLEEERTVLLQRSGPHILHRVLGVGAARLDARLGTTGADPWTRRHLLRQLDAALLTLLAERAGRGGPWDVLRSGGPPLILRLGASALLGESFAALAARCRAAGRPLGAEIACIEAVADPAGFAAARARLAEGGGSSILGEVPALALLTANPAALRPDFIALTWSPGLTRLPAAEASRLAAALRAIGPQRLVLAGAEGPAALAWGAAHGLRRFRGSCAEAVLDAVLNAA
jgi:hypothetical protein